MTAAEDALVRGEAQAARQELAAAWVYFGAPLYDEAWRGEEIARKRHQDRWGAVARKLAALEVAPTVFSAEQTVRDSLTEARASRRPRAVLFKSTAQLADGCVDAVAKDVDVEWPIPPSQRSLADAAAACRALAAAARAEGALAEEKALARDAELRAVLRGDRLDLYERFGDPEPGMVPAAEVARAPILKFIVGPSGPLRAYETWTFELRGDKVVSKRRTQTRESP